MTTMAPYFPAPAAPRKLAHDPWYDTPHGTNSHHGPQIAIDRHCPWIDNDATRTFDDFLIVDHGPPLTAYFKKGDRSAHYRLAVVVKRSYTHEGETFHPRTMAEALKANAAAGRRTEIEIKFIGPITEVRLLNIFHQLAADAEAAYGEDWRDHTVVKVLTNLRGGTKYALRICRAAHHANHHTMLLARGAATLRRFKGHTEITWIRGSRVVKHKETKH
jgi:hypothetical protein